MKWSLSSVQFSNSVVSDSLWPHASQHTRPPCPSSTPGVYSNSCPSSQWCHPTHAVMTFSSCLQTFPASGFFPVSQFFPSGGQSISFSFILSPSSEYSGLISFRMDWFDLLAVQGTLKSLLQHQFKSINTSVQSLSRVWLFTTPWTTACQVSLSITNSRTLLELMSIESVMPSSHIILSSPSPSYFNQSFPASGSFLMS